MADWNLEFLIDLAHNGDGGLLADIMRRGVRIHPTLREFLAAVVAGEIRLKSPRKRTVLAMSERGWQEKRVARDVEIGMREHGKQRDKELRTALTRKACKFYGGRNSAALLAAVDRFLKHKPKPRVAPRRSSLKGRKPLRKLRT